MMKSTFLVLIFTACVYSHHHADDGWEKPCAVDDLVCINSPIHKFLEQASKGIPEHNITPVDPMILPSLELEEFVGSKTHFTNAKVTGIKNFELTKLTIDKTSKLISWTGKLNLNIVSDMSIELTEKSKTFSGTYTLKSSSLVKTKYHYELKRNNEQDYFEISGADADDVTCEGLNEPEVSISPELSEALNKDPDAKKIVDNFSSHKVELRKKISCEFVTAATLRLIENFRELLKMYPVSDFIINF